MESDLREAQMKRCMAETALRIALVDHAKFASVYVATSLLPEEIDLLIVDNGLGEIIAARLMRPRSRSSTFDRNT